MELQDNFILIDKPKGITSFDVIRRLRKQTGVKKWGHAGTLDPLATGLMLLAYDRGTKRLSEFIKLDKEYIAHVRIGERRSTGDMEGEVLEEVAVKGVDTQKLSTVLTNMVGTLTLPVSAYSAIKKDGVPMYKRARKAAEKGEAVDDVPVREMLLYEAELLHTHQVGGQTSNSKFVVTIRFNVGSGTYVRSLAEELGRRLGYPATLQNLRRTKVGEFRIENAERIEEVTL